MPFKDHLKRNAYMREYHLKRYHRLRNLAILQLGGKCQSCGSVERLQLDHIDPKTKKFEVSVFLSVKLSDFEEELKKCQILCNRCHYLKTTLEQGKFLRGTHGTLTTYSHGKCRCQECKDVWNKHSREYKKKRRQEIASIA